MYKQLILFLFSFVLMIQVFSQENTGNDIRLAYEYYNGKEFDKAEVLFKRIFEKTGAKIYFTYYIDCLTELSKFEEAENEIKKQIRKNNNEPTYLIDLAYIYKKQNKNEEADKYNNKVIKNLPQNPVMIKTTAAAFIYRKEYEFAEKTYLKGRAISSDLFQNEMANLYAIQRKYPEMINEYLDFLELSDLNLTIIQNQMQYFLNSDVNNEFSDILKVQLLKRIQKINSKIVFNNFLVWYYMQRKEFGNALIQEIAIDKRLNSNGKNIIQLAETAKMNDEYETAVKAYEYVIEKGLKTAYFIPARLGILSIKFSQLENGENKPVEEIIKLEEEYNLALINFGVGQNTIETIFELAQLQTFYLNKAEEAEKLLTDAVNIRGLDKQSAGRCKIGLGDVLIFKNDLDYAALIYGQAEHENKENTIGDEAKLRKAKLAYFVENFQWAKAQFDALKASTSKPVANDALFYSIHISENIENDSLQTGLKAFARAELLKFRHQNDSSLMILDSLINHNPNHQIIDDAYFLKAKIFESEKDFPQAEQYYKKVFTEYNWGILSDVALYNLAVMFDDKIKNKTEAAEYYKKLMLEHPESIYVSDARRRFRKIREETD